MKKTVTNGNRPSFSLSAGTLTQLLAAFACFLGAVVLPLTFQEFRGASSTVLITLGFVMLVLGVGNLIFGRQLNRLLVRAGKRSRVVIPREGMGYLAIMLTLAVGALLGHRNTPLLVFGMMAGPFVLNGWIVYGMLKGVSLRREVAARASVGELVVVEMTVVNCKRLLASHMLEVRDQISGEALGRQHRDMEGIVTFVRVLPCAQRTGRYQVRFAQRGRYQFGPARISSRFPLGIGERGQVMSEVSEVIIHPQIGVLLPTWYRHQKELAESTGRPQSRPGLFDDDFHRIREYRTDDNPRSIHWRSTARRGELMICEYQQNRQSDLVILLDLPDLATWSAAETEMAVSLAATICFEQTGSSSGREYLMGIATDRPIILASRVAGGFREEALDALAVCERSAEASLEELLQGVLAVHPVQDDRIVLITPRPEEARRALAAVTEVMLADRVDLLAQTTIVHAVTSAMELVFSLSPAAVFSGIPRTEPGSNAVATTSGRRSGT